MAKYKIGQHIIIKGVFTEIGDNIYLLTEYDGNTFLFSGTIREVYNIDKDSYLIELLHARDKIAHIIISDRLPINIELSEG